MRPTLRCVETRTVNAASTAEASSFDDAEGALPNHAHAADERLRKIAVEDYDFVWRSLRRLGVRPPETDDAAQQVFTVLAQKLPGVEPGKERSYLFGIVRRVAANARRARLKLREVPEEEAADTPSHLPSAESELDDAALRAALDEILAGMSEERRVVFMLAELEELSFAEIAELLQVPVGTVGSRIGRAREDFRAAAARIRARWRGV